MAKLESLPAIGIPAIVAWVIASVFGYLSESQIMFLTPLSALDSLLVAAVCYYALAKVLPQKVIA